MKRKKLLQKVLSAALAASMVMSLTACGGSSNSIGSNASGSDSTQTTAASTEKADATAATETKEETKERQTVTFMTIDFNAGTSNTGDYAEEIKQKVEDATGVNLEIEWVLSDVTDEKITLAMANPSTMPMIITHSGSLTGNIVSAAKAGAFVDLNDYICSRNTFRRWCIDCYSTYKRYWTLRPLLSSGLGRCSRYHRGT